MTNDLHIAPEANEGEPKKLTRRQKQFIVEYLKDLNGTQAAIRAGYSANGAGVAANRLLKDVYISGQIETILTDRGLTPGGVISRLTEMAQVTVDDFFDFPGGLPLFNADKARERGVLHLIESIEYDPQKGVKIKFADKQHALELVGRYHGMFKDKHEVTGAEGAPITIGVVKMDLDEL